MTLCGMDATGQRRRAEIVGAGIAGLTAAAALAARGWAVRVHERNAELREIGAGISLRENGIRALEAVGAWDELVAGGERIAQWELRDERLRVLMAGSLRTASLHESGPPPASAPSCETCATSRGAC